MSEILNQTLKEQIHHRCVALLEEKIEGLKAEIGNLRAGVANDSKSSMGDKYETSREMSQQEINRLEQQLAINNQYLFRMKSLPLIPKDRIGMGSLVDTNIGLFYISTSLGEIKFNGKSVFVISQVSPLGKLLAGRKVGDQFEMNQKEITISGLY